MFACQIHLQLKCKNARENYMSLKAWPENSRIKMYIVSAKILPNTGNSNVSFRMPMHVPRGCLWLQSAKFILQQFDYLSRFLRSIVVSFFSRRLHCPVEDSHRGIPSLPLYTLLVLLHEVGKYNKQGTIIDKSRG